MEHTLTLWLLIIGAGLATFTFRLSFIVIAEKITLPPLIQQSLRFVPAAALSAIILPELILRHGTLNLAPDNERLLAGLIAMLVAWRTRNVLLTIVIGMGALWILQALM